MIFGKPRKAQLDLTDAGAIKKELSRARELLPAAEQACASATTALEACLARGEMLQIALAAARREAGKASDDSRVIRDPEHPGQFIDLGADDNDAAKAVLRQRERLWQEHEAEELRARVQLTDAGERRGALRAQVRGLQDRLDQLQAPPAPRRDPLALGENAALVALLSASASSSARAAASADRRS